MPNGVIDYEALLEDATRTVVRRVLLLVSEEGCPVDHRFVFTFDTSAPGVELPESLRRRYSEEMTVVLEHQFWNLQVTDWGFSVELSFDARRARVGIPWQAMTAFADPAAGIVLRFGAVEDSESGDDEGAGDDPITEEILIGPEEEDEEARGTVVPFRRREG